MNQERLTQLTIKKLRGELSSAEKAELDGYEQSASVEELRELRNLEDEQRLLGGLVQMYGAEESFKRNRKRLIYPTSAVIGKSRRLLMVPRVQRYISIAAALLFIFAGGVIWRKYIGGGHADQGGGRVVSQGIKPGTSRAVLVLDSGQSIVLDSAASGAIANQGGAQVSKIADGKLTYQPLTNTIAVGFNTVSTPQGGEYYVELPDRTRVWLNAASSIRFPTAFTGAERRVTLTGEAYFEVSKDEVHPFIVEVEQTSVKVLGTHFNVKAYQEDGPVRTTLLEGLVEVSGGAGQYARIRPGQQAISDQDNLRIDPQADTSQAVAWKEGYLSFGSGDITTVMNTVKRWYDVSVVFEGPKSQYQIEGKIPRNSDIKDVLRMLGAAGYHFRITGKTIYVNE